jgi:spore coat protein U-like protein
LDSSGGQQWIGNDGRGYGVFDDTTLYQPLTVNVRTLDAGCPFYVTVTPMAASGNEGALSGSGGVLRYTIYRDPSGKQILQPSALASDADVLSSVASTAGQTTSFQVSYSIAPQQVVTPGTYTGQILVSAYEGRVGTGLLRAQHQVPLTVRVPALAELSLSDGIFDVRKKDKAVNFGKLNEGDIKGVTIHARSNGGYRIFLRSDNNGALRNLDPGDTSTVPYDCFVDGQPMPLGRSDREGLASSTPTDPLGRLHRIDFRIGSVGGATAGDYQDVVTVTVVSLQ